MNVAQEQSATDCRTFFQPENVRDSLRRLSRGCNRLDASAKYVALRLPHFKGKLENDATRTFYVKAFDTLHPTPYTLPSALYV